MNNRKYFLWSCAKNIYFILTCFNLFDICKWIQAVPSRAAAVKTRISVGWRVYRPKCILSTTNLQDRNDRCYGKVNIQNPNWATGFFSHRRMTQLPTHLWVMAIKKKKNNLHTYSCDTYYARVYVYIYLRCYVCYVKNSDWHENQVVGNGAGRL